MCVYVCICLRVCLRVWGTVEAASAVLVINVLREAILLQQLVGRVLELWQRLGSAADVSQGWGALRGTGVGAEQGGEWASYYDFMCQSSLPCEHRAHQSKNNRF